MKIHIITVGEPKLAYARTGWQEYLNRLQHYHQVRISHIPDKWAYDGKHVLDAAGKAYTVALVVTGGEQHSSPELAAFLDKRALEGRELCFIIGGPEGLPSDVVNTVNHRWNLSPLTFPHDLAMVILAESLYRASTIAAGQPYHK